jgi:hypothetical protein
LLRGLGGAAIALPFLETFAPKKAKAGEGDAPPYAIFVRQGNGVQQSLLAGAGLRRAHGGVHVERS